MRPPRPAVIALLLAVPASAQDNPLAGDLAPLQGTWTAKIGPNKDLPIILVIKGDAVSTSFTSEQGELHTVKAELKLDETATPKAMDWVHVTRDGQEASNVLAIYELRGETLKIRSGHRQGDPRPSAFLPETAADLEQAVFTRQDPAPNPDER
jgi:uncharacterized protein (TIGR03067 family)